MSYIIKSFEVRDINAAEARYLEHMENIDYDSEFCCGSSNENDDFDISLAKISKWSEHLPPVQIMEFYMLYSQSPNFLLPLQVRYSSAPGRVL